MAGNPGCVYLCHDEKVTQILNRGGGEIVALTSLGNVLVCNKNGDDWYDISPEKVSAPEEKPYVYSQS